LQRKLLLVLSAIALLIPDIAILAQAQNGYTTFIDPQGLFSMQVPQGWYCQGGSYVDPTGVPCYYVDLASPDGSVVIKLGDRRITPVFDTPLSGKQFAEWYYQNYIANSIQGLQVISDQELQDGSGAVVYTDGNNGGVVCAKTMPMGGNKWGVSLLYSVIAPASELNQAVSIVQHMIETTVWNTQQQSSYASNLMRQTQDYTNDIIGNVIENQNTVGQHAMDRWTSVIADEPDTEKYVWDCDGQTIVTDSYVKPAIDCELVY
jgi:hypothetical protein